MTSRRNTMDGATTSLVTSLVKKGTFGDVKLVEVECKDEVEVEVGKHFTSELLFVDLRVKAGTQEETLHLVMKVMKNEADVIERFNIRDKFQTEAIMYHEIIPALGLEEDAYPKLFYADVSEHSQMYVFVFENVVHRNFINSKERVFLDMDHITQAVMKIAQFHSFSFILKHENPEQFKELTKKLKKTDSQNQTEIDFQQANFAAIERGVKAFRDSQIDDNIFDEFLESMKPTLKVWEILSLPEEPFDVICHGDYCNNNVMYKYNNEGVPIDCLILDFQRTIYGNLAWDLTFFLYMHVDADKMEKEWDNILKTYWDTLRSSVPKNIEIPPFEEFQKDFASRAVFGYLVASFLLPMMMDREIKFWTGEPLEVEVQIARTMGGENVEKCLVDIVSHLYRRKYIHAFLRYMKSKIEL